LGLWKNNPFPAVNVALADITLFFFPTFISRFVARHKIALIACSINYDSFSGTMGDEIKLIHWLQNLRGEVYIAH
jgi:hypothetical protein